MRKRGKLPKIPRKWYRHYMQSLRMGKPMCVHVTHSASNCVRKAWQDMLVHAQRTLSTAHGCDNHCHIPSIKLDYVVQAPPLDTHLTYSLRVFLDARHLSRIYKSSKIYLKSLLLDIYTHTPFFFLFHHFYSHICRIFEEKGVKVKDREKGKEE